MAVREIAQDRSFRAVVSAQVLNALVVSATLQARLLQWLLALPAELLLVVGLVGLTLMMHGLNMFNMPGFGRFGDEGIYLSEAWAVLREGKLAPYTYFYDHAPAGWLLAAAWMWFTGGPHAFGSVFDSGRMLMLLVHVGMVPLVYQLVRKLGGGVGAATLGTFLFVVSPLATYYHRVMLLDTLMVFWVLVSLSLLLNGWGKLSRVVLSGVCFGIAVLTKETAIFLLPGLLYIAWQDRWRHQGRFAVVSWFIPMGVVVSLYPLYALYKGELLPSGVVLDFFFFRIGSLFDHVSLLDTLKWQSSRSSGGMFTFQNEFWQMVREQWLPRDAFLCVFGVVATAVNLVRGLRDRRALAAGLLSAGLLYYMARGGVVFDFYIAAIVPFLCLNIALIAAAVLNRLHWPAQTALVATLCPLLVVGYIQTGTIQTLYEARPADAARAAVSWIQQNIPADSYMIIDDHAWVDLHDPAAGGPAFTYAHTHWKVASDPEIRTGVFKNDWHTVDYLLVSGDMYAYFDQTNNQIAIEAMKHAHLVESWQGFAAHGIGPDYLNTAPDRFELWKVDKVGELDTKLPTESAMQLNRQFLRDGAMVASDGSVGSADQASALLRAVWSGDQQTFRQVWQWTQTHLLLPDGLPDWRWQSSGALDGRSESGADADTALALLLAGKRWDDPSLVAAGRTMAAAIWDHDVVTLHGVPYLAAGNWAQQAQGVLPISPGQFAPNAYMIFAQADPAHDWDALISSGYRVLEDSTASSFTGTKSVGLPPDWLGIDRATTKVVPLETPGGTGSQSADGAQTGATSAASQSANGAVKRTTPPMDTTTYGPEAARAFWRVALHSQWSQTLTGVADPRASRFLQHAAWLVAQVEQSDKDKHTPASLSAVFSRDGTVVQRVPSLVGTASAVAALDVLAPDTAQALYASQVVGLATQETNRVYWGDPTDLATQEWGWNAAALYNGLLQDYWNQPIATSDAPRTPRSPDAPRTPSA